MCAHAHSETRYFASADVDGFPLVEGEVAAYCPRQAKKVPLSQHAQCEYFEAMEEAELLGIVAVRCGYSTRKHD